MSEMRSRQSDADAIARGHEPDQLRVRAIVWFVIGFIAFAIVAHWGIWLVLKHYVGQPRFVDRPRSVVQAEAGPPSGAPALQPIPDHDEAPREDVAAMHAAEDRVFRQLGWSAEGGRVRIPDSVISAVAARAATQPAGGGK